MAKQMIVIDYPTTEAGMAKAAIAEAIARGDHDWAAMLQTKLGKFTGAKREAHSTMFEVDDNTGRDTSDAPRRQVAMAREAQYNLIRVLRADFDRAGLVDTEYTSWVDDRVKTETMSAAQASAVIADLKKALGREVNPKFIMQQHERSRAGVPTMNAAKGETIAEVVEVAAPAAPKPALDREALKRIPDGYYALRREDSTEIDFLRIKHKKDGFISVKRVLGGGGASPRLEPMRWVQALAFAVKIEAAGIDASHKLYADEMRRCFLCNLELTDDDSRAVGMGPTCRSK